MQRPYPVPPQRPLERAARPKAVRRTPFKITPAMLMIGIGAVGFLTLMSFLAVAFGLMLVLGSGNILPTVTVGSVALGGMTEAAAAAAIEAAWQHITVRDGDRTWRVPADMLGITVNAQATAQRAMRYGRGEGSVLLGIIGTAKIAPVLSVDPSHAAQGMALLAEMVNLAPRNATIRMEGNALVPVAAAAGRALETGATLSRLAGAAAELTDGALDVVMRDVQPSVTDSAPLLAQAGALLATPLSLNIYNPVTNQGLTWHIPPNEWGRWLTTENTPQGVVFGVEGAPLSAYLNTQSATLGDGQFIKVTEAVSALQKALSKHRTDAETRAYNAPTQYTVQHGDTLGSIAWKVGVQMFRIQRANPSVNLEALRVGQVITIPSKDELLPLPVVPNKRIVVSIARQRMWVYENGQVKWEWATSTGISSSPTQPGVYQVQSHDGTAYASNWNLYMPSFLSIYEAVPGFFNGIHGFPSRGGTQVLWENALGRPVTYGCILLSSANAQALYAWAEDGVVVEIQR